MSEYQERLIAMRDEAYFWANHYSEGHEKHGRCKRIAAALEQALQEFEA